MKGKVNVMKKIFNEKGSLIARCIVFQIAMSLLGFFVMSAVAYMNDTIILLAGIFTMLFYFAITGATLNEDGLKDALASSRINSKPDIFYGAKYVAVSYIPVLFATVLASIFRTLGILSGISDVIIMIIRFFFSGMYLGIDMALFITGIDEKGFAVYNMFSNNGYSLIVYQIFSIIICGLFYYLGIKGINLVKTKEKQ